MVINLPLLKVTLLYLKEELEKLGIEKVDGVLYDFGVSSPQLDTPRKRI